MKNNKYKYITVGIITLGCLIYLTVLLTIVVISNKYNEEIQKRDYVISEMEQEINELRETCR